MSDNITSQGKTATKEFKKIGNPHLKRKEDYRVIEDKARDKESIDVEKTVANKDVPKHQSNNSKSQKASQKQNSSHNPDPGQNLNNIVTKESLAESLIKEGHIDSFVDFFYISSRKTPDIKSKYEKEHNIIIETHQERTLAHNYELTYLKGIKNHLVEAENSLRDGNIIKAINHYKELVTYIQYTQDIPGPMYFVQKCINLSKRYDLIKQLIDALIEMGNRFDNTFIPEDLILSMSFKEEAKKLYKHLSERQSLRDDQKDYDLEKKIYTSLIDLYKDLSIKAENQNNFDKAIEYLNKQLENLQMLPQITSHTNEKDKEKYYIEQQIEVYLKIANLNFKMRYYDATLECLGILKPLISNNSDTTNLYLMKGLFLYAQTHEAQEQYNKAIECLNIIEKIENSMQSSEDNIYEKSLLNLGRLHFRQNNLELAFKNLKAFFKKAKSTDNKELLDIGRVNLGMIRGTQAMKEYVEMTKLNDFNSFLKMKLKFFSDSN